MGHEHDDEEDSVSLLHTTSSSAHQTHHPSPLLYRCLIASNILLLCMLLYASFSLMQETTPAHVSLLQSSTTTQLSSADSIIPSTTQAIQSDLLSSENSNTVAPSSSPSPLSTSVAASAVDKTEVIVVNEAGGMYRWSPSTSSSSSTHGSPSITSEQLKCLMQDPVPSIHELGEKWGTDKVTGHRYDVMYDFWFAPYRCKKLKLLEIGLGCDMSYGPGKSYHMVRIHSNYTLHITLY